ncbi:hypothetical protein J5Y04_07530 [Kitasatospora sp. RG8]|uniref:hypothetical protein n=1 Tax=Kitasatospora sp. RG8 TaxID=2820815 RepID=UPI001ADEE235|nr:hypothetical protein [Kitasatospora sp. RG8]MBP0449403.1 hypothetical protein [Kitasatospora sp. RG8]
MNSSDNLPVQDRPTPQKPVWPRNLALSLAAAAAAFGVMKTIEPAEGGTGRAAAAPSPASASPAARPAVPLDQAFPAEVKGPSGAVYTRVTAKALDSCAPEGSVGPLLSELVRKSKGCVGHQTALYTDAQNNRFSLSVLTMQDPRDTAHLLAQLSMAFGDQQVSPQTPPPGWGLPALPAGSGKVQAFSGIGRALVVGLGQWSDGRTADFQKLTDRLSPLLDGVTDKVAAHEAPPTAGTAAASPSATHPAGPSATPSAGKPATPSATASTIRPATPSGPSAGPSAGASGGPSTGPSATRRPGA